MDQMKNWIGDRWNMKRSINEKNHLETILSRLTFKYSFRIIEELRINSFFHFFSFHILFLATSNLFVGNDRSRYWICINNYPTFTCIRNHLAKQFLIFAAFSIQSNFSILLISGDFFPLLLLPKEIIVIILHLLPTADRMRARVNRALYQVCLLWTVLWEFHVSA